MLPDIWSLMSMVTVCVLMQVSKTLGQLEKLSSELCIEKGFSSNLLCSSCIQLDDFGLDFLKDECQQCCHEDSDAESKVGFALNARVYHYPSRADNMCQTWFDKQEACLDICIVVHMKRLKSAFLCETQAFVKGDKAKQFPNLRIKYKKGADPVLKFMNADDVVQETLGIERWNTDTVEEFLQEKLKR